MSGNAEQVMARLVEAPERFDFFAALRIIEAAHAERARLGEGRRGGDEPVRLAQPPELAFPPGDIAGLDTPPGRPPRLRTHLMGLFGPHGPLPLHLTVRARERARREQDTTLVDFCDVFHHRMLAFFYRAWAAARPVVAQDRPGDDRFAHRVGALAGLAHPAFADRHALPDRFALYGVGLLTLRTRPAEAVARLVAGFLAVPARIEEFVGAWLEIPEADRARLGQARLGHDTVLGRHRFERAQRFRLWLGPLSLEQFHGLLPNGAALPALRALVRLAAGPELDWEARLVLRRDEVPEAALDGRARLGWTSWLGLGAERRMRDADDLALDGGEF